MSGPAIQVENIDKQYTLGLRKKAERSIRQAVTSCLTAQVELMPCLGEHWQYPKRLSNLTAARERLNMIRHESHRATIVSALKLLARDIADRRSPEIRAEVANMLKWTLE